MSKRIFSVLSLVLVFLIAKTFPAESQFSDTKALLEEAAKAMDGMPALRSLKNEVVKSAAYATSGQFAEDPTRGDD